MTDFVTANKSSLALLLVAVALVLLLVVVVSSARERRRRTPSRNRAWSGDISQRPVKLNPAVAYTPPGTEDTLGLPRVTAPVKTTVRPAPAAVKTMTELRESDDADDATQFFQMLKEDDGDEVDGVVVDAPVMVGTELVAHSDWYQEQMAELRAWSAKNLA